MKFALAAAVLLGCCGVSEAGCLFKGRIRHMAHRVVDVPFKAAAGVKATVKGPAAPCANGKCPAPQAAPAKK